MIEKKYIAIVGLAATVLVTSACIRNAPVNNSETESETSAAQQTALEEQTFTFDDLTANERYLTTLDNI